MSTETPKEPIKLTRDDLMPVPLQIFPEPLRKLIEGLRALPNVSDMAVITTIAELDRIATTLELATNRHRKIFDAATQAVDDPAVLEAMRQTGAIPPDIMQKLMASILTPDAQQLYDERPADPNCNCDRCTRKRAELLSKTPAPTRIQ